MKIIRPSKDTILKTLIAVGIVAIVVSLYIQYGKPYVEQLALEQQDKQRIADLDSLNNALNQIITASTTQFIGNNNTIYISLPSDKTTCENMDLPSVPDGWQYHCVATSTLTNTDGTGWLPVSIVKENSLNKLPIDPINNATTLNYYAYVASSSVSTSTTTASTTNEYVLAGVLDSKKYVQEKAQKDRGIDDIRYEVTDGENKIWGDALGLVGYWKLNLDKNQLGLDETSSKRDLVIPKELIGCNNYCITNSNADHGLVYLPTDILKNFDTFSYSFDFKTNFTIMNSATLFNPGKSRLDVNFEEKTGKLFIWYYDSLDKNYLVYKSKSKEFIDNNWHNILVSKAYDHIKVRIDGKDVTVLSINSKINSDAVGLIFIPREFSLKNIKIYSQSI